ncbi:MAG: hypothetical protein U0797_19830 [Gemmataceae bacterium]
MNVTSASSGHANKVEKPAEGLAGLASLEAKVNALLPPRYQCFDAVSPTSMGSAGLKYGADARVAWDQIWTHFCDLALAGGPPHRGSLLEPPTPEEVEADPAGNQLVTEEVVRGVRMTTGLAAAPAGPGWVAVRCRDEPTAAWLLRAVVAENVFARRRGLDLHLPAGPWFRLAKEVKNVIVALAKTCHYWDEHLSETERVTAAAAMEGDGAAVLLEPASRPEVLARESEYGTVATEMARAAGAATGWPAAPGRAGGWVRLTLPDLTTAAWFVRAAIAENVLARREESVLYLPVPAPGQPGTEFEAVQRLARICRLWAGRTRPAGWGARHSL